MSVRDVFDAIDTAFGEIIEWDAFEQYIWVESQTRCGIIDPIIRALGWDTSDTVGCIPEFSRPNRACRVGYALFRVPDVELIVADEDPLDVIIECKPLRDPLYDEDVCGLQRFAETHPPMTKGVAVLTSGNKWWIYDMARSGPFESKLVDEIDVLYGDPELDAEFLHRWLARERF